MHVIEYRKTNRNLPLYFHRDIEGACMFTLRFLSGKVSLMEDVTNRFWKMKDGHYTLPLSPILLSMCACFMSV